MKKIILFALCIISYAFGIAQNYIELDKISEIRAQEEGVYVIYTGEAITTFYGSGGILIQDETGAIYVKSYDLSKSCAAPADAGYTNLKISYIAGIFHKATDMEMTQIEIEYDEDAYNIEVLAENVDFSVKDVTLEELITNPNKFECQAIKLSNVKANISAYSKYFKLGDKELAISTGQMGEAMSVPAEGTFIGYYGNNGNQGFIIPEEKYITATGYNTLYELKTAKTSENAISVFNPVLVNRVVSNNNGTKTLYIQQDYSFFDTYGTTVIVENLTADVKEGDSIVGIKGYVTKFAYEGNKIYGSKIEQRGDLGANIQIINSNNTLNSSRIQELEYLKGEAAMNFEATLCSTPVGTIIASENTYKLVVTNSNTNQKDTIFIAGADFSSFIGTQHALIGIIDAGIINPGYATLVVRSVNDILLNNYKFNTIAEMRAAGKPLATDVTYELVNPVLVTYKREYSIDDVDLVGVHIQDATGGYFVKKQITDTEKFEINAGDSVTNFKGVFVNTAGTGYMLDFSDIHNTQEDTYKVISSGNPVDKNPIDVTIKELASDPHKYSSRVIRLSNVLEGDTTYEPWWSAGYPVTEYYLYQEGCSERMFYTIWNYPLYERNNIVGIFDDACYAEGFTIIPLSQNHITEYTSGTATDIDNSVISDNVILYHNGNIIINQDIDAIEIYNINGALVLKQNVDNISIPVQLNAGVYIIKTYSKQQIKIEKIIVK